MPASKSAAASTAARAHSSHSDAAHRQEPPALNVHYVPARMPAGVVTGLWGGAVRREDDGSTTPLKLGDVVRKGDVLLTEQRGIVQLTVDGKQFLTTGDPELDKLVARLDDGELDFVTGAGGEGGEGSLQAGLVVDRVIEVVSPQEYQFAYDQYRQGADLFQGASGQTAPPVFEEADVVVGLAGPTRVVEGQTAADYTVTLRNPAPVDVTVTLAYAGVATAGSDFTAVTSVTIPAGQSSATFDIATIDDALAEGSEPFTVTIVNVSGNDAAIVSIDPERASVTTTITDDAGPSGPGTPGPEDTCLVSISGPDSVVEGETASGYTVSLSQPAVTDVVVKLTYSGTATNGSDFTAVTSVTIPAGQTSAVFDITTLDDALAEGTESFTVSLSEITGGGFEAIAGDPAKATVTTSITDDSGPFGPEDTCLVSISGPDSVVEGEVAPGYTVSLSQPAVTDVVVKLTYSGTATDGSDFTAVTSVTIPAGQTSAVFDIATLDDALAEGTESFTVSLGEITGGGFEQIAGDPSKASITTTITDDPGPFGPEDTCLVSISGPDSVVEGEVAPGYTVSLSQPAVTDVIVKLTYSGTATDGSDFTAVTSVTIPAGQSSAVFDIATLDDALAEGSETITLSLGEIIGGGFEAIAGDPAKATVTTTLTDDTGPKGPEDTCLVSISGPDSVVEGETAPGYTVSLSQPAVTDVVVKLIYSGTATDGSDFTAVTSVTIPAGQSSAVFDIATLDDALAESSETITLSIGEITGGGFEQIAGDPAKASITTTLTDDPGPFGPEDTCLVSISGPDSVVEGETAPGYTISLSQSAVTDVVVKLTYSGTATDGSDFTAVTSVTIPAGQTSAVFDITTLDDALAEGSETITLSLGEIIGGGFEAIAGDPAKATVTTTLTDDTGPKGPEDTCLVSISGPDSVVEGETAPGYTVSLSQPAVTDVVVKLTYSGTATDGSDFTGVTSVTIPAGQTSVTFDIATLDDALAEDAESFTVSLGEITGGGFEQIAGDPAKASITTTLTDDSGPQGPEDTCLVSISGPDSVVEGEVAPGYTVSLSQPAVTDVVVKLTYSGTATNGSDFTAVTSVTIPAGQSSAVFDIATLDDALAEGSESFTVSLGEITGGGFEQIAGDPGKASITTTITDDPGPFGPEDTCLVSITGPDSIVEGETAPSYTVSLSQPAVTDVVVKLTYSGTATDGSDFTAVTSVTIPAGQSSVVFDIATLDDALAEGSESFTVSLGEITGGGFEQIAGDPAKATVTTSITDDSGPFGPEDTCLVSISGPDSVVEGETASGYTVSLSQPAGTDVVVKLTYSGTATDGSDFTAVTSVTIPAGQSSAVFDIATLDDALAEGTESFTVSLGEISGGGFEAIAGDPDKATVTTSITDDPGPLGPEDTCLVSITGPDSVVEGEVAPGYTISLSQPAVTDVIVKLTYSGTATDGSDFTAVTSVTIPAGQSSAVFEIATLDDALAEGSETITLSIGEITGGGFEQIAGDPAKASITTTLTDDSGPRGPEDTCLVSISGPDSVVEGETAPGYTVSLSQPAVTDVVVKLTYSGTATDGSDFTAVTSVTIPAGQTSAVFDIATLDDALAEDTESFTVSLSEITGGGFEQIAGDPAKASITTTLTDDSGPRGPEDTCLVSISGPDSVVEGEVAPGYTVSLSQPAVTDVVVKLTYSGTATDGSDFTAVTSVTIPAGQSSVVFDIATLDDALAEGSESFTVSLGEITGGGFEQIVGDPAKATVTTAITDDAGPSGPGTPGPEDTCLVSISGPDSVVEGETASGYTVSLSQPAVTDVVVKLTYSGTATNGSDFTAVTSVTIPAGQLSAVFDIATLDDALAEGTEAFTVSLGEITGGGFEAIAGDPDKAMVTTSITDDSGPFGPEDTCLVSISGPDSVVEGETAPGYTVSLSQPAVTDVIVKLTYSGTATDGSDFTAVTSVTIPAGQSSVTFDIKTFDDALAEGSETITLSIGEITGGGFEQIAGDPGKASITTTLTDDSGPRGPEDTCLVSISGPDSVVEGETAPGYTVSLSQPAVTDVVVKLTYSGTATDGSDFTAVTSVTVLAGQTSAKFDIATLDDALAEGSESFTISLGEITGGGFEAIAGDPAKATVTTSITDDAGPFGPEDTCLVSISGPDSVVEGEVAPGYTVALSQPAVTDVIVKLTYSGTATDGSDFTAVTSVTIPAGQSSAVFDIATLDDALAEGSETITLSIGEITGGGFEQIAGDPGKAAITTTLIDDTGPKGPGTPGAEDTCLVSISGPDAVTEGEVASGYTVTLSQASTSSVTVQLSYSGTAESGADFTKVALITIPPGVTSYTFGISTQDDALAEGTEQFSVTLGAISGGSFEAIAADPARSMVSTSILDDAGPLAPNGPGTPDAADQVLVSITGPASVVEGEPSGGYVVALSQPAVTDVVVRLVYSGTAADGVDYVRTSSVTIPAGQSSTTFHLATVDDALAEGTETITVALGQISGGGFEEIAGDPAKASVTTLLHDDSGPQTPGGGQPPDEKDTVLVSLTGPDTVVEGDTASGYTVTLSQAALTDVQITLTYSGTASAGADYTPVLTVTVPAGQTSVRFDLPTQDDALAEGNESLIVALGSITGGGFEAVLANPLATSVTTSLVDDVGPGGAKPGAEDTVQVSLTGPGQVLEGEIATGYTVTLSQAAVTDVVVKLNYSGTATDGSDYTRVATVTIPAGQTSTRFDIATLPDSAAEGAEQYTVALGAISGGGFEEIRGNPAAFSVTTTITDTAHAPTPLADQGVAREDTPVSGNVLDNDRDPDGNPLCVTSFTWGDVHHPVSPDGTTSATLPGIGTLVVGPDGRYTFTPAKDYAGPVPEMSYTVSDGALTAVSTLTLSITQVNDAPTLRGGTATLSEEGLSGGIPDSSTETRATQATGTLQFSDVDSPSLRFTLEAPTGLYASGGKALVWTGDGSAEHPLLGTAGGEVILRATIDGQGRYTVDLLGPLDHPVRNTEDTLTLSLGVQVSDGEFSSTASLDVTVRDDSPTPFCSTRCADLDVVQNNLLITLDVSGSMGTRDGVNGETRLQSAIKSITKLIDSYDQQGEVAVRLVTFSTSAAERGDQWMSVAQAKSTLASLCAGGNTNYDAALDTARGAFTDSGRLEGGHNVAYFFSDGRPNLPTQDVGIDAGEAKVWQDFLNQHDIQSYAIGLGRDVPVSALDPVAWNGVTGTDDLSPLLVSSFTQLDAVLAHTVTPAISGDVVAGGLKSITGADGGHLSDIIVNGVHHPWDPATSASDTVSIKTAAGGAFTFNMETGHYTYQGPAGTRPDYQEVLQFTVTDGDGDSRSGQMTLKVNADGSSAFDGYCAPAPTASTCLSGGVLSWTLADHQDSCSTPSTDSQCTSPTLQLGDVLGGSGSSQDTLSSWSGSGCTTTAGGSGSGSDPCLSGSGSTIDLQLAQTLIKQTADTLQNC